ncbi:MAG TPA: heparinase II/III family protein, partial [Chitinophagaceae bacterium]|nr:heparinase II/III family protein [Chitinophagaceae bacterium]
LKKGLEPSMDTKFNSWLRAEHNWNQVCNAGMTYGAMAIYEDHPDLARNIINRAIGSIALPMKDYGPDGAYPEGYGYWGYGTSFNVLFISAIEKLFGTDFDLSATPGFLKTAAYMQHMTGTTGKPFNYSDAGGSGGLHPAMFWFATKTANPSLLWVEKNYLEKRDPSSLVKDRLFPALMLWKRNIAMKDIVPPNTLLWTGNGKSPVAMMRTDWKDTGAIYVGLKAGSASVNHAHMDIGSFVMDADGVRWAMDFGMQDYESLESKGIQLFGRTQDAQRWTVFRLTNLVHNTLAFNNQHQRVSGYAPITATSASPSFMHTITDLSEVYKSQVTAAKRGIAIVNKNHVVVRDEIQTSGDAVTLRWTMLTPAEVKISANNKAELTKDGKKLFLEVASDAKVMMKTWSTDPPNSYDAANPGTTLVGFEVTLPANALTAISVKLIPSKASKESAKDVLPLSKWK